MPVKVRAAIPEDIPRIIEVERLAPTAAHWNEEQYRLAIDRVGDLPGRLVLVMESEESLGVEVNTPTLSQNRRQGWGNRQGALAGFLVARHVAKEWELENIVVAPEFRGQGIGTRLIDALFARACETGSSAVFLEVRQSNTGARRLYQNAGFREVGQRKLYYSNPPEDAIVYCRDIA